MKILFLSDNFPPESNAPATRLYEHATRWVAAGHHVTVITCAPNFPEGVVYDGYRNNWYSKEIKDGIHVIRVKTYITANEGFLKRTLDYLSFMITSFVAGIFQSKPDVVVATSPQFFCAVSGWMVSAVRNCPYVFELRDLWPASITAVGAMKQGFAIRILERIEHFLYRKAHRIISVTSAFKKELIERGIDGKKIDVVTNGVDLDQYRPVTEKDAKLVADFDLDGKFVAAYLGTHGMAHALDKVLETAELLRDQPDVVFVFAGGGAARKQVEELVREKELKNVRLIPRQPKEMMPALWGLCDVSLVTLRNVDVFRTVIPSKVFEAMGMGIPMIISVPEGEITGIVEQSGCGLICEPENPEALAKAILELRDSPERLRRMREKGLRDAPDYSRDVLSHKVIRSLENAITQHRGG